MKYKCLPFVLVFVCLALAMAEVRQVSAQSWTATNIYNNWTSVAMSSDGSKIAADSFLGGIYTSTNGGTNWQNVGAPDQTHWSVLASSSNGGNLVAAFYSGGIYTSTDWGLGWTQSMAQIDLWNCLASSADGTRLVAGTSPGQIYTSKDSGATFTSRLPQNQGYQALAASADGQDLVAAVFGGGIYRSVDAGETWVQLSAPTADWSAIASSASGANLAATIRGGAIYTSSNAGLTWTPLSAPNNSGTAANGSWSALSSSSDGSQLVAVLNVTNYYRVNSSSNQAGALIYVSANYGANWLTTTSLAPAQLVSAIAGSTDGSHLVAVAYGTTGNTHGGYIYYSTNSALTWAPSTNAPGTNWSAVATSTDGSQVVAAVNGGSIYSSPNSGQTWTIPTGLVRVSTDAGDANPVWLTNRVSSPIQKWAAIASSADGTRWVAAVDGGGIFTGTNSGGIWQSNLEPWDVQNSNIPLTTNAVYESQGVVWSSNNVPAQIWSAVYSSSDGNTLEAVSRDGWSYKSIDGGVTWSELNTPNDFWQSLASSADGSKLLAASQGGAYMSTNAGSTWSELVIATNANIICTDAFAVNGIYTNYVGITVTNSGIVTTNYSITTNYLSDLFPVLTSSNLIISGNGNSVLNLTNAIGFNLIGTNFGLTNIFAAKMFGVFLQGSNVFGSGLIGTNVLGAGSLGSDIIVPNSGLTNVAGASLAIPYGTDNTNGVALNARFYNVISTNVFNSTNAGINVLISNVINITVVITNMIQNCTAVASSADGSHLAVAVNRGFIFISTNSGVTWFETSAPATNWSALAMSADGSQLTAAVNGGLIYSSSNSGASWVTANVPASNWRAVATSADGAKLVAVVHGGALYTEQSPVKAPVPALQIQVANGNVILSWAVGAANVVVQQSSNIAQMDWVSLSTTQVVTNGQNQVILPMSTGQCLYRLEQP